MQRGACRWPACTDGCVGGLEQPSLLVRVLLLRLQPLSNVTKSSNLPLCKGRPRLRARPLGVALNERGRPDHGLALLTFPSVLAGDLEDGLGALSKLCPRENEHAEARIAWFLDLLHHSHRNPRQSRLSLRVSHLGFRV